MYETLFPIQPTKKGTKMKPIGDNIIVQFTEVANVTESGLVLPESAVKRPQTASVIAVAPDQDKVIEGASLIIRQHAGMPFEHDGNEYHLIHVADIIAVLA